MYWYDQICLRKDINLGCPMPHVIIFSNTVFEYLHGDMKDKIYHLSNLGNQNGLKM